jgi:adenosylcobinamide-GDP ribazoletransferase
MEIMHDERIGAFGFAGGVLLLLLKVALLTALPGRATALLLTPTLARWGMTLGIVLFPYARAEGLGRAMKDHAGGTQAALATVIALATAWFGGGTLGLAALALTGLLVWAVARFVLARIPGLTGDIYGALGETAELVLLLFFAVVLR